MKTHFLYGLAIWLCWLGGCTDPAQYAFRLHTGQQTGIQFQNVLAPDSIMNMFKYMYFYNGAGIGAGDFNNDGQVDIFLAGNQVADALYLNKGNLQFEEITTAAGIANDGGWSTGVSIVDINNDGLLDIYVCRVGNFENLKSTNLLWVCTHIDSTGVPHYQEKAAQFGLHFSGFSTQALFFDYDLDGDLDMYLMNHAVHHSGMFAPRASFAGTASALSGDRLYKNENGTYRDVTEASGILSYEIGYGLGIVVCDANTDGWPDLYIGNDFHENDYLYINQKDGTFAEAAEQYLRHTSQFTMGVDAADINNDGLQDLVSLDMLPADPYILKRSLGEDAYDIFNMKVQYGYQHQYARNNLQLNTGAHHFTEIGLYAGIYATDWSWSALWVDFDKDGLKDLFVGNGIPKRLNDMDYVSFVTDKSYQQKIRENAIGKSDLALIEQFPEIKIPNYIFSNKGNARFEKINQLIENDLPSFSNGAVYADFDNDGDLDVMVNNIAEPPMLYENLLQKDSTTQSWQVKFEGLAQNTTGLGSKVVLFCGTEVLLFEKQAVRGFLSSMEGPLQVACGNRKIDSAWVVWPNNTYALVNLPPDKATTSYTYTSGLAPAPWHILQQRKLAAAVDVEDITQDAGLDFIHVENDFREFNREALLPRMLSTEGPALALADVNGDGLQDIFCGGAREQAAKLYLQQLNGRFLPLASAALAADSAFEDVDAAWSDVNGDGYPDLIVVSGGNEYYGGHPLQLPRLYVNDGKGKLTRKQDAFDSLYATWGCLAIQDINSDGYPDIFLGARAIPFQYGATPASALLINDGKGRFTNQIKKYCPELEHIGMVTDAQWCSLQKGAAPVLLICTDWGSIYSFEPQPAGWKKTTITQLKGWWQSIAVADLNGDGFMDIIAGNMGLNNRLHATEKMPVRMYVADFDANGTTEQILTYYLDGREIPFANKDELTRQLPSLKKKYLFAGDFARASLSQLIDDKALSSALLLTATTFEHFAFFQQPNGSFVAQPLPWQTQTTSIHSITTVKDSAQASQSVWLAGNFYENNIQMGRQDAGSPMLLGYSTQTGHFWQKPLYHTAGKGQVRRLAQLPASDGKSTILLAKNNDTLKLLKKMP